MRAGLVIAAVLVTALLVVPQTAQATFPGENGRIAFIQEGCDAEVGNGWLLSVNPDGSDEQDIARACVMANWSPSGARIMFDWLFVFDDIGYFQLGFSNPNGSARSDLILDRSHSPEADWGPDGRIVLLCSDSPGICIRSGGTEQQVVASSCATMPAWSPDGGRIAFWSSCAGQRGIAVVPATGGPVELIVANDFASDPDWSPDGRKLVYVQRAASTAPPDLYSVNANGRGVTPLTSTPSVSERQPAWSPDGTQIVFSTVFEDVYRMNADGTSATLIGFGRNPDWQPLPVDTASSHARPAGATPFRVPLVPAVQQCTAPNRTHAPPLAFPSCNPPVPGSPNLTVGVGDGDPAPALSIGFVRLSVRPGVPGGEDDAEVVIRSRLSNVMRAADLSEYPGDLLARVRTRLTDKQGTVSQTTQDFPLAWQLPCTSTAATNEGSLCELTTTLDALRPGAAAEGTRANWALDQVRVYDGGPDEDAGTTADNSLLAVQGVFVP